MDDLWRSRAESKRWDEVKADLGVYRLSGQTVKEDPRQTPDYRNQVVEGLGFGKDSSEKRPNMSEEDILACREVLYRKSGGFWLEGSPRTTVRNVLHDCVPTGPPISQQPHNLKGESAAWVDEKLEEEVQRGQLVRGSSAWGSPPFPTKEAPAHKKSRKRRLVVDYRRVNARVRRSTYYCRKATDVLATAAGSVWYSFVDAVTGFNQIANTRRAMEILAIVARSGKFLPVCLTFGPVNGPDDFCFVVDRAYSPGRGRKLKYTKEWVAYVDDLTVRTGRVVDGKFLTDGEADHEIRAACQKAPVSAGQDAASALEALGVNPQGVSKNKGKHDEQVSDHNHPTREVFGVPPKEVLGSRWVHAGLGVLAGSLCAGQRMLAGTGAKRRTFAGNQFRFPRVVSHVFRIRIVFEGLLGVDFRSPFVRFSSHRFHDFHDMSTDFSMNFVDFDFCSLVSGVQQGWKWIGFYRRCRLFSAVGNDLDPIYRLRLAVPRAARKPRTWVVGKEREERITARMSVRWRS